MHAHTHMKAGESREGLTLQGVCSLGPELRTNLSCRGTVAPLLLGGKKNAEQTDGMGWICGEMISINQ